MLLALLTHTMFNMASFNLPALETMNGNMFYMIVLIVSIIATVRIYDHKRLVRNDKNMDETDN